MKGENIIWKQNYCDQEKLQKSVNYLAIQFCTNIKVKRKENFWLLQLTDLGL